MTRLPLLPTAGLLLFLLGVFLLPAPAAARDVQVTLRSAEQLDAIGPRLRQAINAYEAALHGGGGGSLPTAWTRLDLSPGEALDLGTGNLLLLQDAGRPDASIVLLTSGATHRARLTDLPGELGPLEVTRVGPGATFAETLLVRARERPASGREAGERPRLLAERAVVSNVRIDGYESPARLVITAPDERTLAFARRFVEEMRGGASAEVAVNAAWRAHPPQASAIRTVPAYVNPVLPASPSGVPGMVDDDDFPFAAQVTLHLVRAESSAMNALLGELSYDSSGARPDNPRVTGSTGAGGGDLQVGSPGDRFEGRLRALERTGRLRVESESLVYVPLGGSAMMTMAGPGESLSARLGARRQGQHVYLDVDQRSRGWEALGSVSTRVRLRDGQTLPLARNTYQRVEESSSGPPILPDIPYLGPIFGSSQRSSLMSEYALFATVNLN